MTNLTTADLGVYAKPGACLQLLTLHKSKGREFDAVAIVDLHEGRIPHWTAGTDPERDSRGEATALRRRDEGEETVDVLHGLLGQQEPHTVPGERRTRAASVRRNEVIDETREEPG